MHTHTGDMAVFNTHSKTQMQKNVSLPFLPSKRQVIAVVNTISAIQTAEFLKRKGHSQ